MEEAGVESREEQTQRDPDHRDFVGPHVAVRQSERDTPHSADCCYAKNKEQDNGVDTGKLLRPRGTWRLGKIMHREMIPDFGPAGA